MPGLFWSQTDMFRFEMSRAGSVTEGEKVEGGGDKAREASKSGPQTFSYVFSLFQKRTEMVQTAATTQRKDKNE